MRQILAALVMVLGLWSGQVAGADRIALVVGNAGYTAVTALDNSANDARLIGQALEASGFDVEVLIDANLATFASAISEFGQRLRAAGPETVGLFYYAGHGVQSFGSNYLLPVDAALTDAADLDLVALSADAVLRQMASARNRTNIFILDACRNNPFDSVQDLSADGLARMNAPAGAFISYATGPGQVALDGVGDHSPFSAALAREMAAPGAPIEAVFKAVRNTVIDETRGLQTPWDSSTLTDDFVFRRAAPPREPDAEEERLWAAVRESGDPVQITLFLRSFPEGRFASEARGLLEAAAPPQPVALRYEDPIRQGTAAILGRSIADAVAATPLVPHVVDLPDVLWRQQTCATCHIWTREALCDQGRDYVRTGTGGAGGHPYGGSFRSVLERWADGGCQ